MEEIKAYLTPNDCREDGMCDSDAIQAAVDKAAELGINAVMIPRHNDAAGKNEWIITKTILLPDGMTVVLDNCYIRLHDGAYCRVFENSLCTTEKGGTLDGIQYDIKIVGRGHAVIDGGKHNGLYQDTQFKYGLPGIEENCTLLFRNVRKFEVSNFRIINQRWHGLYFICCRDGKIADMDFESEYDIPDRVAITVGRGCSNFIIEKITGRVDDDFIRLMATGDRVQAQNNVIGIEPDIHDIIIDRIECNPYTAALVKICAYDGCKIYNVNVTNVIDGSRFEVKRRSGAVVSFGDKAMAYDRALVGKSTGKAEDIYNVTVRDVTSRSSNTILVNQSISYCYFNNIKSFDNVKNIVGNIIGPVTMENVVFDGLYHRSTQPNAPTREKYLGSIADIPGLGGKNIVFRNIFVSKAQHIFYFPGGSAEVVADNVFPGDYSGIFAEPGNGIITVDGVKYEKGAE